MADDDAAAHVRLGGWEAMNRNLAADQVVAEAALYAAGWRQMTVHHEWPVDPDATGLIERLVERIDDVVALAGATQRAVITCGGGSITWAFPPCERTARQLVVLGQLVVDDLNPGGWTVTADDYP